MDVYLSCKQKLRLPWHTLLPTSNWYSWQIACLGKHTVSLTPWSKVTFPQYGFPKSFFQGKGFGSSNSLKEVCSTIGFHTLLVAIGTEILHRIFLKTPYRVLFSRDVRQSNKPIQGYLHFSDVFDLQFEAWNPAGPGPECVISESQHGLMLAVKKLSKINTKRTLWASKESPKNEFVIFWWCYNSCCVFVWFFLESLCNLLLLLTLDSVQFETNYCTALFGFAFWKAT